MQIQHTEWLEQWSIFQDDELFLFKDWIQPFDLTFFKGKSVLEAGCGGGQHTRFMAPFAKHITAVDLNTIELCKEHNKESDNIEFVTADIAEMNLGQQFDIVLSIGVVHHTDNPEKTVENLKRHLKKGGTLILWVYSEEGNWLAKNVVERCRNIFLSKISRERLVSIANIITALMYIPIYSLYFLPLSFLPYYDYFQNFRKMSYKRNVLNVFDKLNAPQTDFISSQRAYSCVSKMRNISVIHYKNVSYCISATMP